LGQLVIVSNRVAIPEKNAMARAGGLEVAVKAALKHKTGIWFGNNCPRCER
jgi:trehalose 6-phosphate synthase